MEIKIENGKMKVRCDYNRTFITKAKELQGKWESPFWVFPEENEELVRAALMNAYGEDGRVHDTVVVDLNLDEYSYGHVLKIGSIVLVSRRGRDTPVTVNPRAVVIAGGFSESGGSSNSPAVTHKDGTIVRVKDLPVEIYNQVKDLPGVYKVDLDAKENKREKKANLERERAAILKRLSEIDELLKEFD